jgi:hypothetical protein
MKAAKWVALGVTVEWAVVSLVIVVLNWPVYGPSIEKVIVHGLPLLLEFLRVLVSWPAAIALVVAIITKRFREQIGGFIDRMEWLKAGNFGVGGQQDTAVSKIDSPAGPTTEASSGQSEAPKSHVAYDANADQKDLLERNLWGWYYMYQSVFLTPHTQAVLMWFNKAGGFQTAIDYEVTFKEKLHKLTSVERESQTIIETVINAGLIEHVNDGYQITSRGRGFLTFVASGRTLPDVGKFVPPE